MIRTNVCRLPIIFRSIKSRISRIVVTAINFIPAFENISLFGYFHMPPSLFFSSAFFDKKKEGGNCEHFFVAKNQKNARGFLVPPFFFSSTLSSASKAFWKFVIKFAVISRFLAKKRAFCLCLINDFSLFYYEFSTFAAMI